MNHCKCSCLLLCFLLIFHFGFSQPKALKDKLQGNWLCVKITNPLGDTVSGEFGYSGEYLRFSFENKYISIAQAPFDKGMVMPVNFGPDTIDPILEINWFLPNLEYKISKIDSSLLVLDGINQSGNPISYTFINQKAYRLTESNKSMVKDMGFIIVSNSAAITTHVYGSANNRIDYKIFNSETNLFSVPVFKDNLHSTFASYLTKNFVFPKNHHSQTLSDELIIEFTITKKGLESIRIVKGLGYEINAYVYQLLESSRRKWFPLTDHGKVVNTTLRLHFLLLKEE